jgi:hypothetical protein
VFRLKVGKKGLQCFFGGKGVRVSVGRKGTRTTVSAPGTGLSYSTYKPHKKNNTLINNDLTIATQII